MFRNTSLASRLLLIIVVLAALPLLLPANVSAGWFGRLFHKKRDYDPIRTAPHCQQYYGHFPTCWRTFPEDFQNCPPGGFCPTGQSHDARLPGNEALPAEVPAPEPALGDQLLPGEETLVVPPAPYEEPEAQPEPAAQPVEEKPAIEKTPELEVPKEEAAPPTNDESSSNQFLPPVPSQSSTRPDPNWKAAQVSGQGSTTGWAPLVRLGGIEAPEETYSSAKGSRRNRKFSTPQTQRPISPQATGEVAELLRSVRQDDSQRRYEFVYRLGLLREEAVAAVPTLTVLLNDPSGKVRMHAALALWRITKQTEFAVPTLTGGLTEEGASVQSLAAMALGEIGPAAKEAVPTLVSASVEADGTGKVQAAEALWKVAGKNANSIAVLVKALNDTDSEVRWVAAYALAEIAPRSRIVVRSLTRRLADENAGVREVSAFALGSLGTNAKSAAPQLLDAMTDENAGVRDAATRALLLIDP